MKIATEEKQGERAGPCLPNRPRSNPERVPALKESSGCYPTSRPMQQISVALVVDGHPRARPAAARHPKKTDRKRRQSRAALPTA